MNPNRRQWWSWARQRGCHGRSRPRIRARHVVECLEARTVLSVFTPTTFADGGAGTGSLRSAIIAVNADPGRGTDVVQLLSGTYSLTEGELEVLATAHQVMIRGLGSSGPGASVIDANGLSRVFQLDPGTRVTLEGVEITGGMAQDDGTSGATPTPAEGGGILDDGATLTLDNVLVDHDTARGAAGSEGQAASKAGGPGGAGMDARGGGLYVGGGQVLLINSVLTDDDAQGGTGGNGGAGLVGHSGTSYASGGPGGDGGAGQGGGIYVTTGAIMISHSVIDSCTAQGGDGGNLGSAETSSGAILRGFLTGAGGNAQGGGLYIGEGSLILNHTTIDSNTAHGGDGGAYYYYSDGAHQGGGNGQGGGLFLSGASASVNGTSINSDAARGGDSGPTARIGNGGDGMGGGVFNSGGIADFIDVALGSDIAQGGDEMDDLSRGGDGQGGGLCTVAGTVTLVDAKVTANTAQGGGAAYYLPPSQDAPAFGLAGTAEGGGVFIGGGNVGVAYSSILSNTALGGVGGFGDPDFNSTPGSPGLPGGPGGSGEGGGLFVGDGSATVADTLIADNIAQGGVGGAGGVNFGPEGVQGDGGTGGVGAGGGVFVAGGAVTLRSDLIVANTATGGDGGSGSVDGSTGTASGGGLYSQVPVTLIRTSIVGNQPDDADQP